MLAARALAETRRAGGVSKSKRDIVAAVDLVAQRLGNTRAVCRKCYIHPAVIDAFIAGTLSESMPKQRIVNGNSSSARLSTEENAVLELLRRDRRELSRKKRLP